MTKSPSAFLDSLQRFDLSLLLAQCQFSVEEISPEYDFEEFPEEQIIVHAPIPIAEAINSLPPDDRKRIAQSVASCQRVTKQHDDILVVTTDVPHSTGAAGLLAELLIHREMMIAVATGGPRIQDVDDYYKARDVRIRRELPIAVAYENPHSDLWSWYRHWSNSLPQYKDRRSYVRQIFGPVVDAVSARPTFLSEPREATGWERVDRALSKGRNQLQIVSAEEDCQAIGLLCREVIISLAQAVYDPEIHTTLDGVRPSPTDANRMLESYIGHVFPGESFKEVRAHARASLALALNLQHRRTATKQLAALCLEATASTTAVISIIARTS